MLLSRPASEPRLQDARWITQRDWRDLDRRETLYLVVTIGYVPFVLSLLLAATFVAGDVPRWFGIAAGLGGISAFYGCSAYLQSFRCPDCGFRFNEALGRGAKQCAHCHLERGTVGRRKPSGGA